LLEFYIVGQESCKEIEWKAHHLNISKYISSTTGELLQSAEGPIKQGIIGMCRLHLKEIFNSDHQDYFHYLNVNLLDDIGRYFASDAELIN
jgi:hypothetical protein